MSAHPSQRRSFWPPNEPPHLPSISEMFPEHFMICSRNGRFVLNDGPEDPSRLRTQSQYSSQYDIPQSPVLSTSPQPTAASSSTPCEESTTPPPASPSSDKDPSEKKHKCPTCSKRFSRPSSLRTHVNTHTGETPFRCPFPRCGREFNVNSNMRRHYRNHAGTGNSYPTERLYDDGSTPGLENPCPYPPSSPSQRQDKAHSQTNDSVTTLSRNRTLDPPSARRNRGRSQYQ